MTSRTIATPVMALTLVATLGGLLFGYDTAVISGAIGSIDANFIDPRDLSETAASGLSGFAISCALFGCIIGGALGGRTADWLGRKRALLVAAALFLISALGSAFPEFGLAPIGEMGPDALAPFIAYRILGGIGVGMASLVSPLYIAEIAPKARRGQLVSLNQIAIVFGIVGVYFVNWAIAAQGDGAWLDAWGWRWMFASEAIPAALFLVLMLGAPDTPRWLVMQRRTEDALGVLRRLGSEDDPHRTLKEIEISLSIHEETRVRDGVAVTHRREEVDVSLVVGQERLFAFGKGVILVGILLSVFQQFVGINAVLYYAPLMFENMGASKNSALLQTIVVGVANVGFTLIATFSVDRIGRRPLMFWGAVVMAAAMLTLGTLFATHNLGVGALIAMVVYIAGFAFSWGPVVWILLAEIFPNAIKGRAMAIAVAAQWIANLGVSWSFKVLDGSSWLNAMFSHGFAYWLYGAMSLLAAWFVWRWLPETKGHSLEEMEQLWGGRRAQRPLPMPAAEAEG